MYYVPHFEEQAPRYVYILGGISLFAYMILDNLDGKQARRTNSSSPLGQLFDHGCDALNVTLSGMSTIATCQMKPGSIAMSLLFVHGHLLLFAATLEEYHTGAMVLREVNGPNEGLLGLVAFQLLTGILGPDIWSKHVPIPLSSGLTAPLNDVAYVFSVIPALAFIAGHAWGIAQYNQQRGKSSIRAICEIALQSINVLTCGVMVNGWPILARAHFRRQTIWISWLSGGLMFDIISRMMIAHLAKAPYPYFPKLLIPALLCFLNAVAAAKGWNVPISEDVLTRIVVLGTGIYNLWRVWCLIRQLCDSLNVRCFRLGPKHETKEE